MIIAGRTMKKDFFQEKGFLVKENQARKTRKESRNIGMVRMRYPKSAPRRMSIPGEDEGLDTRRMIVRRMQAPNVWG